MNVDDLIASNETASYATRDGTCINRPVARPVVLVRVTLRQPYAVVSEQVFACEHCTNRRAAK